MEEQVPIPPPHKSGCINCGNPIVVPGYPNALCADCREKFIRYPIPMWIKLFAAGILAIITISLARLPQNITLGIQLQKGIDAANTLNYFTAEKELKNFIKNVPSSEEANANLIIAAFYNLDFKTMGEAYERIKGKKIEDNDLYHDVENVLSKSEDYFPSDSFNAFAVPYQDVENDIPDSALLSYMKLYHDDIYAATMYASKNFNLEKYSVTDSVLQEVLKKKTDYLPALYILISTLRQEGKTDMSLKYCENVLEMNHESLYILSSKARTLLKAKRDKEALEMALNVEKLSPDDSYNIATLALVYHFNNMPGEKNRMLKKMTNMKDSANSDIFQYAFDVISNKEKFRD